MDVPELSAAAVHHRRGDQHLSRPRGQARHRARTRSTLRMSWASRRRRWRSCRPWKPSPRKCLRPSMPRRCARWPTAARSPAACSTGRWLSTTRSAGGRAEKGIVSPVAGQADILSCPTWKPATCWPSSSTFLAGGRRGGHRAGRARADHPDQPRRQRCAPAWRPGAVALCWCAAQRCRRPRMTVDDRSSRSTRARRASNSRVRRRDGAQTPLCEAKIDGIGHAPHLTREGRRGAIMAESDWPTEADASRDAARRPARLDRERICGVAPVAVGHRVVHGGAAFSGRCSSTPAVLAALER